MPKLFWACRAFGVAAAAMLFMASGRPGQLYTPIPATPARFAYDQIEISQFSLPGEKTIDSPPGSFERDYDWAATGTGDDDHKYATLHHVAYFGGWTRVETAKSIQLANRRQKIVIIADKVSSTFRRYTGARAEAMLAPDRRSQYGTVAATTIVAAPGTAVYKIVERYSALPAITLDGIQAVGQRTIRATSATGAKGSCASGRLSVIDYHALAVTTEYRASFAEPVDAPFYLRKTDTGIVDLCRVRVVRPVAPVAQHWFADHFLLYRREENSTIEHGKTKLWNADIIERGHIRALSEKDRGLLDLPPKYVDGCSRHPEPSDCEPLATYAKLQPRLILSHPGAGFFGLIQARDGTIWFAESGQDRLGRIGRNNVVNEIAVPIGTMPEYLTETPDGTIWFTENGFAVVGSRHSGIGSYAPNGTISEPVSMKPGQFIGGIDSANDGTVWYSYGQEKSTVGEITRAGGINYFPLPAGSQPAQLRLGADGNVWVAQYGLGSIARLTLQGRIMQFPLDLNFSGPFGIASDRSAVWFTATSNVGYLDMENKLHLFTVPRSDGGTGQIVTLPNGDAAFTEDVGRIGIISRYGNFAEFAVPGNPDSLLFDREGNLWYTDPNSVRMIPNFLQITQPETQGL